MRDSPGGAAEYVRGRPSLVGFRVVAFLTQVIKLSEVDVLGEQGTTIGIIDRTPFQRLWLEFSTIEETSYAVYDEEPCFLEFIDIQFRFHQKAAEIAAQSPAYHFEVIDNITNTISPALYTKYCIPIYDMYTRAFLKTNKKLAVHCDGLLSHIRNEIAHSPFDIIDSFTVPPVGDVTLTEAKNLWPQKTIAMNLAPHLAHSSYDEVVKGYEEILSEWGNNKLIIEHVEDMPQDTLEMHLSAVLDVCGYPSATC
jgi:uroporphyrinogen-III decarboxylase